MKNALILHGAGNNSQGNWFPWLKDELEKKGFKVWSPDLPNSDVPNQTDWLNVIFSQKNWKFDKDSIIIGHSSGATLILRILEKLPDKVKIDKSILVAGFVEKGTKKEFFHYKEGLLKTPFNWNKIKNSCNHFDFISSDNDRYQCGQDQGKIMQQNLGGELIIKKGQDHFNLEASPDYKKFPFILELVD